MFKLFNLLTSCIKSLAVNTTSVKLRWRHR